MLVAAEQLVARLPVYRSLISLVAVSDSLVGVAVSDVYLSCARPLPSATALPTAAQLAAHQCGALVLGLPFGAAGLQGEHAARHKRLLRSALDTADSTLLVCAFAAQPLVTADTLAQRYRDNLLWEQTALDELGKHGEARDASIVAAVVLQTFLDEHAGGWANTFG
jgi:RNase H-fold protein (predicted Holliday junction resolvase)